MIQAFFCQEIMRYELTCVAVLPETLEKPSLPKIPTICRGVKSVVIHMNFGQQQFDWVDLDSVLSKWQLPFSRKTRVGIFRAAKTWKQINWMIGPWDVGCKFHK